MDFVLLTAPVFQLLGVLPLPILVIRTVLEIFRALNGRVHTWQRSSVSP